METIFRVAGRSWIILANIIPIVRLRSAQRHRPQVRSFSPLSRITIIQQKCTNLRTHSVIPNANSAKTIWATNPEVSFGGAHCCTLTSFTTLWTELFEAQTRYITRLKNGDPKPEDDLKSEINAEPRMKEKIWHNLLSNRNANELSLHFLDAPFATF